MDYTDYAKKAWDRIWGGTSEEAGQVDYNVSKGIKERENKLDKINKELKEDQTLSKRNRAIFKK